MRMNDDSILIPEKDFGSITPKPLSFPLEFKIVEVNIADLKVDRSYYQRPREIPRCKSMASNWVEAAVNPPMVCKRKGTGVLYINNGQHTVTGAQYIGMRTIKVMLCLHETTALQEKELFCRFNDDTKAPTTRLKNQNHFDLGINGIIKDAIQVAVNKIVVKNNFVTTWEGSKATSFDCHTTLINLYNIDEGKHLDAVLNFMNQAWCYREDLKFANIKAVVSLKFLLGISEFFKKYEEELNDCKVRENLLKIFRQNKYSADAIIIEANKCGSLALVIYKIYNKSKHVINKLLYKL